jgi:hypothetical protein
MTVSKAIHVATFNAATLQFFKSPDEGPQIPWHAQDDLFNCLELNHNARMASREMIAECDELGKSVRIVLTDNGIVTIAAHCTAQGLIAAIAESRSNAAKVLRPKIAPRSENDLQAEYAKAVGGAIEVLTDAMSDEESYNFVMTAYRNDEVARNPEAA